MALVEIEAGELLVTAGSHAAAVAVAAATAARRR
jgi:hypothetical protein